VEKVNYQATFDVLWIAVRLESPLDGLTRPEIHLFCYIACLLSIYRRRPSSEWSYGFIRSQWGAPFSSSVNSAIDGLIAGGLLVLSGELIVSTPEGRGLAAVLSGVSEHSWRTEFLEGACASALAMPAGAMRSALRQEPSMRGASVHHEPRPLLTDSDDVALYEQFDAVNTAIGSDVKDLMVPSIVWLSYLGEVQRKVMQDSAVRAMTDTGETDQL
jgi:hypothetical protein